jgi:predicted RNA binding protein YcfA (HicA-like mRNA interferase family)
MPGPVRFAEVPRCRGAEVPRMLEAKGYTLSRCKGSHFQFVKPGAGTFTVPVHNNLVKAAYAKKIRKL